MYEPVYEPGKTYFTEEEIANFIAWGRESGQTYSNQTWIVAYHMSNPVNYPNFPPLELDSRGEVVNTEYWIEVGEGSHAPRVQHERNTLMRYDRDEWERIYFNPYQNTPLPNPPSPTPTPAPTPSPTPIPTPTPTPSPIPSPPSPSPTPTPGPYVKPTAVSHRQGRPPAVTKIGPAPSTFTSIR